MNEIAPGVRCAIYTRKSTEEGLEQEFNTLQAQREAAEAYILSQKQNGWHTLVKSYNDGGFSGASLDRPALKQLLEDIQARQIDCVVVYKVDRLSRSLLDFARLLSLFEKRRVSFVSVTQEFNTTTSMGRLTLNILLSFAQFEREIISERTRDKMSAARRKGKWVGGAPVLGYDVDPQGGRLVINQAEAERVREIFTICAGCPTLASAQREVTVKGLRTKDWTSARGRCHPASAFTPSRLAALVSNVLYIGQISYKGVLYAGEQPAIVDRELWSQVQEQLKLQLRTSARRHEKLNALLSGLLYCAQCGEPMGASFTSRQGRCHIYYFCRTGKKREPRCRQKPIATSDLESSLFEKLEPILGAADRSTILLEQSLERVSYDSNTREVRVTLRDGSRFQYLLPVANRPGVRHISEQQLERGRVPRVSRLMGLAIKFQRLVDQGAVRNYAELAALGHVTRPRLCQIMMLANLAPMIQEALLFLPKTLRGPDCVTERQLRRIARIVDWEAQKRLFRSCRFTRALEFAQSRSLPLAVRAGGHSRAGFGVCEDGIVIDLSEMKRVEINQSKRLALAQAGALVRDPDQATQPFGLATTLSNCRTCRLHARRRRGLVDVNVRCRMRQPCISTDCHGGRKTTPKYSNQCSKWRRYTAYVPI